MEPYYTSMPCWNGHTDTQELERCAFLPPHEALSYMVPVGEDADWGALSDEQQGMQHDLNQWQTRTNVASSILPMVCLALCGDSVPLGSRHYLVLLSLKVLSGADRTRVCIFAGSKKHMRLRLQEPS